MEENLGVHKFNDNYEVETDVIQCLITWTRTVWTENNQVHLICDEECVKKHWDRNTITSASSVSQLKITHYTCIHILKQCSDPSPQTCYLHCRFKFYAQKGTPRTKQLAYRPSYSSRLHIAQFHHTEIQ